MKKKILLLVLFLVVAVLAYVYFWNRQNRNEIETARANLETAKVTQESLGANVVKADLNLYYVVHRRYPLQISDVEEVVEEAENGNYKVLEDVISNLKNFSYEISGDGQTYRFTYTKLDGQTAIEVGNYQSDFHKY